MTNDDEEPVEAQQRDKAPLVFSLLFLVVAGLLAYPDRPLFSQETLNARGYVAIVNRLFIEEHQWLETAPSSGADASEQERTRPLVRLSPSVRDDPRVLAFLRNSYLGQDIVQDDPVIWEIRNGQVVGLTPSAHTLALPSLPIRAWEGDLRFSEDAPTQISRQLTTDPNGASGRVISLLPADLRQGQSASIARVVNVLRGALAPERGTLVRLQEGDGATGLKIADLFLIGDTVVVDTQNQGADYYAVLVNDTIVPPGQRRAITPGGSLRVRGPRNNIDHVLWLTESIESSPQISLFRPWGEQRQRSELMPDLTEAIEVAFGRIVGSEGGQALVEEDVRLTIDGDAQAELNRQLDSFVLAEAAYLGNRYAIGVTVMDAVTGDIVALGERINRDPALQLDDRDPNEGPPLNFNFRRLQVGSAAKPLIAAAILQTRPDLRDFRLLEDGQGPELRTLLGATFAVGEQEGPTLGDFATECDFVCFLQTSNNRYAAALMLLANSNANETESVPTPGGYWANGEVRDRRLLSRYEALNPDRQSTSFVEASGSYVNAPWASQLWSLYDVAYAREADFSASEMLDGYVGDDTFNASIWREIFETYALSGATAFYGATPERENFAINEQKFFRERMLPVMLGGGDAQWTNVSLAQAYARIVTGEKVQARIYANPNGGPDSALVLPLVPEVRELVTRGMAQVANAGTAQRFFAAIPGGSQRWTAVRSRLAEQNLVFGLFSKTGTPEIETPVYGPRALAINQLIRLNRLRLSRTGDFVWAGDDGEIAFTGENRARLVRTIEADRASRSAIRAQGASVAAVVRQITAVAALEPNDIAGYFQIENTVLTRYLPRSTLNDFGKVYAFVAGAFPQGTPANDRGMAAQVAASLGRPQRAYAVVVNIQSGVFSRDEGGGTLAVRLGARIFDAVLAERLMESER